MTSSANYQIGEKFTHPRLQAFGRRFGKAHLDLACHAAFPLALTPELLYCLRENFQSQVPWIAVADILLSLCDPVGYELYELEPEVRHELIVTLKQNFGEQRLYKLSDFMVAYIRQKLKTNEQTNYRADEDLGAAPHWTALAYIRPERASHDIAEALRKALAKPNPTDWVKLTSLIESYANVDPLIKSGFQPLLVLARGWDAKARGDEEEAAEQFKKLGQTGAQIKIEGVSFELPSTKEAPDSKPALIATSIFIRWVEALAKSVQGRISLANMLCDFRRNGLPRALILRFVEDIAKHWESRRAHESPEDIASRIIEENFETYLCQGPLVVYSGQCSRIMDIRNLVEYNMDLKMLPLPINGSLTPEQVELIFKSGLKGVAKGMMRGGRPIVWVVRTKALTALISGVPSNERASLVREYLGLLYFQKDEHLVEIRYPENVMQSIQLYSPTFLDMFPTLSGWVRITKDGWGRTVNLRTMQDGLPEAVHAPIPFTDDFTLNDLGRLRPLTQGFNWEKF